MEAVCKDCPYRCEGCHVHCPAGQAEEKERKEKSEKIKKARWEAAEGPLFRKEQYDRQRRRGK